MKKILHVYPQLNCGGTEMVMYNLIKGVVSSGFDVDILAQRQGERDCEFKALGCSVFYIPNRRRKLYKSDVLYFLKAHNYQVVHTHTHADMGIVLECAKIAGITLRIAHSHNDRPDLHPFLRFIHKVTTLKILRNANCFLACSQQAAKWLFPFKYKTAKILLNGIELKRFAFNQEKRKALRQEFNLTDTDKVVLHVGRHSKEKNPFFVIELAKRMKGQGWKFLMVGDGPLRTEIEKYIEQNGLSESILCVGTRIDTDYFYSAADVFVFPSLHEGLGIVAIEAQAAGLPCFVSEGVPDLADIHMGLFEKINLGSVDKWIELLNVVPIDTPHRLFLSRAAMKSAYDIKVVARELEDIYCSV